MSEPGLGADTVLVQVVPVESGREIGWGSSTVEAFRDRFEDVREAVVSGTRAVADSLPGLPSAEGWQLNEVSGSFGICLTAEAGVILTKASAAATFEVTVTFQRRWPAAQRAGSCSTARTAGRRSPLLTAWC
jgi:Trypsin-co-occurring domain 1